MSIWGKVIGGVAGFALGGPLGAVLGAAFGHAVDRSKSRGNMNWHAQPVQNKQTAFTIGVIVLSAKMAKADGQVTRDEIDVFKRIFQIPANDMRDVGTLFNEARRDAEGYRPYAAQIGAMFANDPAVLENLLGGLFQIAMADGVMHPKEMTFLKNVAAAFGLDDTAFERIRNSFLEDDHCDAYEVLGVTRSDSDADIKKAYRRLIKEHHPDTLIAKGMPQEFIDIANETMAAINDAYEKIEKDRSLP